MRITKKLIQQVRNIQDRDERVQEVCNIYIRDTHINKLEICANLLDIKNDKMKEILIIEGLFEYQVCANCNKLKTLSGFTSTKRNRKNNECKNCVSERSKEHYYKKVKNDPILLQNRKIIIEKWKKNNKQKCRQWTNTWSINSAHFNTYANQLNIAHSIQRDPTNPKLLQVRCTYCNKWFNPTSKSICHRINALNGKVAGECQLYCSGECKINCPTYWRKDYPKGFKKASSREVVPDLRKMVFELDDWACVKCGETTDLHCHHVKSANLNKMIANDVDNCITVCKSCHKAIHMQPGCGYNDMKCPVDIYLNQIVG